jgi:hypothetical protein
MHIIHLIERRYPQKAPRIIRTLLIASISALAIGVGLLILQ